MSRKEESRGQEPLFDFQNILLLIKTGINSDGDTGGEIQLSEKQEDILAFIRVDGDTTATKMAKLFGISKRTVDRVAVDRPE